MYKEFVKQYFRIFYGVARVVGFCIAAVTLFATFGLAMDRNSAMDPVLRWGLVGLMAVLCVLGVLMVRAPTSRRK